MKIRHILYVATVLITISCSKEYDVYEHIPAVEIVSAEPTAEGTIVVTGRITNFGTGDPVILGFCADSIGDPRIHQNQTLVYEYSNNEFSGIVYPGGAQSQDNRLFINVFAGNDIGLGKGTPIELTDLDAFYTYPQFAPPCKLESDQIYINGSPTLLTSIGDIENSSQWAYSVSATSEEGDIVYLTFGLHESTDYTLTLEPIIFGSQGKIKASVTRNGESLNVIGEPEITIVQIDQNRYAITICNAYLGSVGNATFDCRIITGM